MWFFTSDNGSFCSKSCFTDCVHYNDAAYCFLPNGNNMLQEPRCSMMTLATGLYATAKPQPGKGVFVNRQPSVGQVRADSLTAILYQHCSLSYGSACFLWPIVAMSFPGHALFATGRYHQARTDLRRSCWNLRYFSNNPFSRQRVSGGRFRVESCRT